MLAAAVDVETGTTSTDITSYLQLSVVKGAGIHDK
jgi:hypothetical protein